MTEYVKTEYSSLRHDKVGVVGIVGIQDNGV